MSRKPHRVGLLAFPGVTLLDLAGPAEVFSEANRFGARYELVTYTHDGREVRSSTGIRLAADAAVADAGRLDTVLLPGSEALATAGTGAFLLAATGLLDGRRATTHWRHGATLARRHPGIDVELDAIFVTDGPIATSAGVTAGIDLSLALVEHDHGAALTRDVARSLVVFLQRPGGQSQFSVPSRTPRPRHRPLRELLEAIAADPAGSYSVPELAAAAGTSTRHLTRLFQRELGTTPARHVERVRLEAAQMLLEAGESVTSAALRCGFGTDETLRRAFVHHLGVPPATYRSRFGNTGGGAGS
jgi:transcriptional regulator GlxA family with amidase domain